MTRALLLAPMEALGRTCVEGMRMPNLAGNIGAKDLITKF